MATAVEEAVMDRYSEGAQQLENELCCPVDYDPQYLDVIPDEVIDRDYGCGDPSAYVEEGEDPWISFSHQELADLTGLTRPTTTNLLNEFQEKGMIELGRRKIYLRDLGALTRQAEQD